MINTMLAITSFFVMNSDINISIIELENDIKEAFGVVEYIPEDEEGYVYILATELDMKNLLEACKAWGVIPPPRIKVGDTIFDTNA